jgi:enoyl-CoA hydratase
MGKWLNEPKLLSFEVKSKVAYITLNRPEKRNALSPALLTEFQAALMEADDRRDISCAVLQGAGKDFCAGYDLGGGSSYMGGQEFDATQYRAMESFDDDLWQLRLRAQPRLVPFDMFKPVIAKVHGHCLAGGTDIALMCDIVIAADDAKIGFPPTRSMGSPANHMWLYHAGPQWAKRMLFTGDSIRGKDAAKIGLVLKSVPKEKLDAEVEHLAKRIASVQPDLLAAHKRIVNLGMELMHSRTLQRIAGEHDARAHLSSAFAGFKATYAEKGLKGALRERDEPFGDGIASTDPEV